LASQLDVDSSGIILAQVQEASSMPPERETIMLNLALSILNRLHNEEGQDLAEYGLLLGFLAVVVMIAVATLGYYLLAYWSLLAEAIGVWTGGAAG
jgi:Flp pilus assembly pilin Flp